MTMRNHGWVRGLAALVVFGLVTARPAPAAAAPDGDTQAETTSNTRATLVVQADALGDEGGPSMVYLLGLLEEKVLRERGVAAATSDGDPRIVVVVRPLSDDAGMFDYRVDISIEQNTQAWPDASWGFDCKTCDDGRLLDKVSVVLHSAVTRIEEQAQASNTNEPDNGVDSPPGSEDDPKPAKVGPLVWGGGAAALLGLAAVGVGLPFALKDDRIERAAVGDPLTRVDSRTPGLITLGTGAAVLLTGAALLGVGLHRWKKSKDTRPREDQTSVAPWIGPQGGGLTFRARF